jgi:hypothetical protein
MLPPMTSTATASSPVETSCRQVAPPRCQISTRRSSLATSMTSRIDGMRW